MLVTTGDRAALAAVKREFPAVPVGLTMGSGLDRAFALPARGPTLPRVELAGAGAPDWAVIHRRRARAGLLAECQQPGIKTMVWTVNADPDLARWVATPGVDALVTDRPARAVFLRGQLSPGRAL
jgi:glycerophosphoryl diester phosphodiesterase